MSYLKFKKSNIFFTVRGRGKEIVLLHGFTESSSIWESFTKDLAKKYRVIRIDLPGHGKSECVDSVHSMELMADVVFAVLKKLKTKKCLMVGHSMGGYVTLAFGGKYPGLLRGFGLFHSHCFADTPQEQENRNRTIAIVNQDKYSFIAQFIPGLFPLEVHKKFAGPIEKLIKESSKMPKQGVIAALEGMKTRNDQSGMLKTTSLPVLFILGLKDSRAPVARLWEMVSSAAYSDAVILRDCGHMGFIEAPKETLAAIRGFARKVL